MILYDSYSHVVYNFALLLARTFKKMDLKKPKQKTNNLKPSPSLPIIYDSGGNIKKHRGVFNGFCVVVDDRESIKQLTSMGSFGKSNLSRSSPAVVEKHQETICKLVEEESPNCSKSEDKKVILVTKSDSSKSDTDLRREIQFEFSDSLKYVHLGFEEAFFLKYSLQCLDVFDQQGNILDNGQVWDLFLRNDENFVVNFVVYYYFRAKKWVVKPGIKFGGDYRKFFMLTYF